MTILGPTLPDLMVLEVLARGAGAFLPFTEDFLMVDVTVWYLVVEALDLLMLPEYFAGVSLTEAEAFPCLFIALRRKLSFLATLTILMISTSSLESEDQSQVSSSSELVSMVITSGSAGGFRLGPCAMSE